MNWLIVINKLLCVLVVYSPNITIRSLTALVMVINWCFPENKWKCVKSDQKSFFCPHNNEDFFLFTKHCKHHLGSKVSTSTNTAASQLKSGDRDTLQKNHFQHILGVSVDLHNIFFQGGSVRNIIISVLTLFFLKLGGNTLNCWSLFNKWLMKPAI